MSLFTTKRIYLNLVCLFVVLLSFFSSLFLSTASGVIHTGAGSKRKSKGMATEHDVHAAGGQKCLHQNLNISFVFWILRANSPTNQIITKKIIDFIKGIVGLVIYSFSLSLSLLRFCLLEIQFVV